MKILKFLIVGLLTVTTGTFAQKGVEDGSKYGHGEDSIRCTTNLTLFADDVKQGKLAEAYTKWIIVFNECPLAHSSIYTDGAKIASALYEKEKDAVKKEEYYNLLMKVYDQRIKYFGDNSRYPASYVKGLKAVSMLDYKRSDVEVVKVANQLLEESLAGKPNTIQAAFALNYMTSSIALFKEGSFNAEKVVNNYIKVAGLSDQLIAAASDKTKESYTQAKVGIEQLFASSGAADCQTIATIFGAKLEANKENLDWLKMVNYLLVRAECTESDLFFSTSEYRHRIEPSSASAYGLAKMYLKQNDSNRALEFYKEAVELETEPVQKSKFLYEMGLISMSHENYQMARSYANKALELRSDWGAPYILIGKLYAAGAKNIGTKEFEKKAGYWVAVDKFYKAKTVDATITQEANELINLYSQYFPGSEELFFEGIQDGATYTVGGWIGEKTTVRAKR
ncbi:MAG: tetratricopeptide repeat protein [Breznakibacter sp.]|nr:tetratricopeptide repeat protein [Breznakibacter sp.]